MTFRRGTHQFPLLVRKGAVTTWMAAITSALILPWGSVFADVVELKTGQRIEGTLKQATPTSVSIDVAGQTLTIEGEKVRAVYFGTAPSAQAVGETEALKALKALQSVTRAGVTYRDYTTRVGDAKIQVDSGLPTIRRTSGEAAVALETAMGYYTAAGRVWGENITRRSTLTVPQWHVQKRDLPESCPHYHTAVARARAYVAQTKSQSDYPFSESTNFLYFLPDVFPITQVFWGCASDKIAEAEKLLGR